MSDAFYIQNGQKQEDSLLALLFNFALDVLSGRSKEMRRDMN
jgi:hypothetical protein